MIMILTGLLILLFSLLSLGVSVLAVLLWFNRPEDSFRRTSESLVVVGVPGEGLLDPATVRAIVASDDKGFRRLAVGHLEGDNQTRLTVEGVRRTYENFRVADVAGAPPGRKVIETWLACQAAARIEGDPVMIVASSARPSTPTIRRLSVKCPEGWVCTGVPVRKIASKGFFSHESDISRLTPVLFGLFGPVGVLPCVTVARRQTVDEVINDPLTLSRPSLGAAIQLAADPRRFMMIDAPMHFGGRLGKLHLSTLFAVSPLRYVVYCALLAAGPLALAGTVVLPVIWGSVSLLSEIALFLVVLGRIGTALTWPRQVMEVSWALLDAVISPVTDAVAFVRAVGGSLKLTQWSGKAPYTMRRGGVMSPGMDRNPF